MINPIPTKLEAVLIAAIVSFFVIILSLLKHKKLALKYTLLWLATATLMLILVIFPTLMTHFASLIGIQSNMNCLYILLIGFLIVLVLSLTSIVSGQTERIRKLTQSQALLERRVRELEEDKGKAREEMPK